MAAEPRRIQPGDTTKAPDRIAFVSGAFVVSISGGGREIRTLGGFNPTAVFKTAALGHYASPPDLRQRGVSGRDCSPGVRAEPGQYSRPGPGRRTYVALVSGAAGTGWATFAQPTTTVGVYRHLGQASKTAVSGRPDRVSSKQTTSTGIVLKSQRVCLQSRVAGTTTWRRPGTGRQKPQGWCRGRRSRNGPLTTAGTTPGHFGD